MSSRRPSVRDEDGTPGCADARVQPRATRFPPVREVAAQRLRADGSAALIDEVAEETPVALLYNGVPHAVMMATPADLHELALGFSLTEGIVASPAECELVELRQGDAGVEAHLLIPPARFEAMAGRGRNLAGRAGCGLCGTQALAAAIRPLAPVATAPFPGFAAIRAGLAALAARQPMNARCGGLHAAGFVHPDGILVREDIGRHNALDKVVGAMALAGIDPAAGFLAITSRASHEVVHKAGSVGIGTVVAISAPTARAIDLARGAGMHLVAFARDRAMTLYSGGPDLACLPTGAIRPAAGPADG
jgi:formate dehydrogenase accessory protein FdhD